MVSDYPKFAVWVEQSGILDKGRVTPTADFLRSVVEHSRKGF